ncbi:MAG TPA: transketolase [Spirochaetota bacterium]|nr:transketolase [Spirochaetota bacterium]
MEIDYLEATAKTIRALTIDAIEKANSGHPGLAMGCADIGAYLFGEVLKYFPKDSKWLNRDRFILSAGHGSMLLYSLLYLSGYKLTLDDIKEFRQFKSKTPGHPEYGWTDGVETSSGPLGQGVGNGVGMALAAKRLAQKFNRPGYEIFNSRIFVLAGDGDMMEGMTYEACSIAGHLRLNNLILIYDSNKITIEGSTDLTFTEDVKKRFEAQNWLVLKMNGHDFKDIKNKFEEAEKLRLKENKPVLIIADTVIGKGSPNKQATNQCHGAPLGREEAVQCKVVLNIKEDFYVDPLALEYFEKGNKKREEKYNEWQKLFKEWGEKFPELKKQLDIDLSFNFPEDAFNNLPEFKIGEYLPTRNASHKVLNKICENVEFVISGSADLGSSTMTIIKDRSEVSKDNYLGYNIQYGIREHAMGAIANGLYLFGGHWPIVGTFLAFVNYMQPAIRMAALMRLPIIYLFSHDSIYVGEDGPSHHPIEHLSNLRLIPNVNVMRPACPNETKIAWKIAFKNNNHPNIIITTRQKVPVLKFDNDIEEAEKGAYIVKKEQKSNVDIILIATGSELSIAMDAADMLIKDGYSVRVVNMFSIFLFDRMDKEYKEYILPKNVKKRIAIEAGIKDIWYKYIGLDGDVIGMTKFGISGKAEDLGRYFGFTKENVYEKALQLLKS